MLAVLTRDSVTLLVSAPKMVRIYLFTSSHLRYKGNEAKKRLRLSDTVQIGYSFGKHCWTEDLAIEDDYFEQKTKKTRMKHHLQPLNLQGEFIILIFV